MEYKRLDVHQLMWRNLLLLDFPTNINKLIEIGPYLGLIKLKNKKISKQLIGPNMFQKSNTNGLLIILHFLICQIYPNIYNSETYQNYEKGNYYKFREYIQIFNIFKNESFTNQTRDIIEAKKITQYILSELVDLGILPIGSNRASLLTSAHGEAPYLLLFHLSFYILTKKFALKYPNLYNNKVDIIINKYLNKKLINNNKNNNDKNENINNLMNEIKLSKDRMSIFSLNFYNQQQEWLKIGNNINDKILEYSEEIDILLNMNDKIVNDNIDNDKLNEIGQINRQQNIEKIKSIWNIIDEFNKSSLLKKTEDLIEYFNINETRKLILPSYLLKESYISENHQSTSFINFMTNWKSRLRSMELSLISLYPDNNNNNNNNDKSDIIDLELKSKKIIQDIKLIRNNLSSLLNESNDVINYWEDNNNKLLFEYTNEIENIFNNLNDNNNNNNNNNNNIYNTPTKNNKNKKKEINIKLLPPTPPSSYKPREIFDSPSSINTNISNNNSNNIESLGWKLRRKWEESNKKLNDFSILSSESPRNYFLSK